MRNTVIRAAGCALAWSALGVSAAEPEAGWPARSAVAGAVEAAFADFAEQSGPGCAVGVQHDGNAVYRNGFGVADLQSQRPIAADTLFNIASMSKQFTVLAILHLQEQGLLSLGDNVSKYLPELPATEPPIRISHLIHHTSGLMDYLDFFVLAGMRDFGGLQREDALRSMFGEPVSIAAPGERWDYNNGGYLLLAEIVSRVSGRSFEDYARAEVLAAMNMKRSYFRSPREPDFGPVATGYQMTPGGPVERAATVSYGGDGGLVTSLDEFLTFTRAMHTREGLWSGDNADFITTPGRLSGPEVYPATGTLDTDYGGGLGLHTMYGQRAYTHSGGIAGYNADFAYFPDTGLAIVAMCNLRGAKLEERFARIAQLYFDVSENAEGEGEAPGQPALEAMSTDFLQALAGRYHSERLDTTYTIEPGEGGAMALVTESPYIEGPRREVFPRPRVTAAGDVAPGFPELRLKITDRASGQVRGFELLHPMTPAFEFTRVE